MSMYFIVNLSKWIKQKLSENQTSRYFIIWRVFASCCLYTYSSLFNTFFHILWFYFVPFYIWLYVFFFWLCLILQIRFAYCHVFLLLYVFQSGYSVSLCCSVNCSCVKCVYHIISYHIISYHIISYHIISYHIIYHIVSYCIVSYHVSYRIISYITSYLIVSYHIISYHIISYHIYHIITYHIASYHIVSYHIISHNIVSSYHIKPKTIAKFKCNESLHIWDLWVWNMNTAVSACPWALVVGLNPSEVRKALNVPSWGRVLWNSE